MSDRDKIIRYYRASGDADLAAKLVDLAEGAQRNRKYKVSEFLDPYGITVAETVCAHFHELNVVCDGGFPGAERCRAAFIHEDFAGTVEYGIVALSISWDDRYYHITHRDVLGSLLGLGLKRDLFGDIIMTGPSCQVLITDSMAHFVVQNLVKVGAAAVSIQTINKDDIAPKEEKVKEIRATVASLRLDTVAAAGFGLSRTKMSSEIDADKVKVNWQSARNASQAVKAGDIISMRGRGRVEVCEIAGQTRKGRISVFLKRFL